MAQLQFSTAGINTENQYDALPPGEYEVIVTESDLRENSKGTGHFLAITLDVQAPEQYRGRKLWNNITVSHQSAKAQEIGKQQLAQLVKACGFETISDSEQMHGIPVIATVKKQKDDPTRNDVKGYKARAGAAPMQAVPQQPAVAAQQTAQQAPAPQQPAPQQAPAPHPAPVQPAMAAPPWMNQAR